MEPAAPQEEINNLADQAVAPAPFKFAGWRHWLPYILGVLFFALVVWAGYDRAISQGLNKTPTAASTSAISKALPDDPSPNSGTQIYFSQATDINLYTDETTATQRLFTTYNIYRANSDLSGRKKILTIGGKDLYVDRLMLVKSKKLLLVQVEHSLTGYDIVTGRPKFNVAGQYGQNAIWGTTVSADESRLVLTKITSPGGNIAGELTGGGLVGDNASFAVITVDLASFTQKTIYQKSGVKSAEVFRPVAWSADNKTIFGIYKDYSKPESAFPIYALGSDGTNLRKLSQTLPSVTPEPTDVAANSSLVAFTDLSAGTLRSGSCQWQAEAGPTRDTTVSYVDLAKDSTTIFDSNLSQWFIFYRWSPDEKELVYSTEDYVPDKNCAPTEQPIKYHLYNRISGKTTDISSLDSQIRKWDPSEPLVSIADDGSQITVNGKVLLSSKDVPESAPLGEYIGFIK